MDGTENLLGEEAAVGEAGNDAIVPSPHHPEAAEDKPNASASAILGILGGLLITLFANTAVDALAIIEPHFMSTVMGVELTTLPLTIGTIVTMVSAPLFGLLADLVGKRKVLLAGVLLLGISIACTGPVATTKLLGVAIAVRVGIALGAAMLFPPLIAYLLEAGRSRRIFSSVTGSYIAVGASASLLSGAVTGPLIDHYGWGAFFGIIGGAVLLGGAIGGEFLGLAYLVSRSYHRPAEWLDTGRGQSWVAGPLLALSAIFLLLSTAVLPSYVFSLAVPDYPFMVVGELMVTLSLVTILAYLVSGPLADFLDWLTLRFAHRALGRISTLALGVLTLCAGWMVLLTLEPGLSTLTLALTVAGIGNGVLGPQIIALAAANVRPRWWSTAMGLYQTTTYLSSFAASGMMVIWPASESQGGSVIGLGAAALSLLMILAAAVIQAVVGNEPEATGPAVQAEEARGRK